MRWQMALYKEMAGKAEDADAPMKVVKRVQEVSAVLYHLEVVSDASLPVSRVMPAERKRDKKDQTKAKHAAAK